MTLPASTLLLPNNLIWAYFGGEAWKRVCVCSNLGWASACGGVGIWAELSGSNGAWGYPLCGSNRAASSSPVQGRKGNTSCRFLSKRLTSLSAMLILRLTAGRMETKGEGKGGREEGRREENWERREDR